MAERTGIQWTDATWNPVRGCSRVSPGCEHCYAETIAARFSGKGQAFAGFARRRTNGQPQWTGKLALVEARLRDPLRWRVPRRIFVNSMSDLFHEALPDEAIDAVFAVMALAPQHTFQVLTKRPKRMLDYMSTLGRPGAVAAETGGGVDGERNWPFIRPDDLADLWPLKNVWLGVSVEDQARADERTPLLLQTPAAVRFLSVEPLLGPVRFPEPCAGSVFWSGIHWVILGGESGRGARPCDVAWIRAVRDQCARAGVACFVKQLGAHPCFTLDEEVRRGNIMPGFHHSHGHLFCKKLRDSHGGDPAEWPEDLRVRVFPPGVGAGVGEPPG